MAPKKVDPPLFTIHHRLAAGHVVNIYSGEDGWSGSFWKCRYHKETGCTYKVPDDQIKKLGPHENKARKNFAAGINRCPVEK
jgi:hypothetical protein